MSSLWPPFRFRQLAQRLLAQHPVPPRPDSVLEVLVVYSPVLAGLAVVIVAALVFTVVAPASPRIASQRVPIVALLVAGGALYGVGIVASVRGLLQKGVGATGEVASVAGTMSE